MKIYYKCWQHDTCNLKTVFIALWRLLLYWMTTPPNYSDSIVEVRFNVKSKQPNNTKDIWHHYKCSNMFNEWFWRSSVVGRGLFTSFYPLVESNSRRTRVTFFSILFLHVTLLFQKDHLTKLFFSLKLHFILKIIHS